ncbi:hypothetical protein B566_EDAN006016 [Ephemera danica]|nr:hypothetical protein B566_EDAN006016 [Ephemera danica]
MCLVAKDLERKQLDLAKVEEHLFPKQAQVQHLPHHNQVPVEQVRVQVLFTTPVQHQNLLKDSGNDCHIAREEITM